MTRGDWESVISQAADLGARHVTFIGGEPTLNPVLPRLVGHALNLGLRVEVFSNLVRITPRMWQVLAQPGVSLATSWYSADRAEHQAITGRDSWRQVRANAATARELGIPLRAGVITGILPGQDAGAAIAELRAAGVGDIGTDHLREFGRGTIPDPSQSCGSCGRGIAAVLPDGQVVPCPMTRWLVAGDARRQPLAEIIAQPLAAVTAGLPGRSACSPECNPNCTPSLCQPRCNPQAECQPKCGPQAQCRPNCAPDSAGPLCGPRACRPTIR